MSTAYYVYAEIQVDGKWYNLSPTMKRPDGTFSVEPIYWAQSSFFDVYNDLESHSIGWGIPDDMSKDMPSAPPSYFIYVRMPKDYYFRRRLIEVSQIVFANNGCKEYKMNCIKSTNTKFDTFCIKF